MVETIKLSEAVRRLCDAASTVRLLGENIPCVVCNMNLVMAHLEMLNAEIAIGAIAEGVGDHEYTAV